MLKTLLKLLLSLTLIVVLFATTGVGDTLSKLSQSNLWLMIPAVLIYLLSQGISAWRWQFLSRPLGFHGAHCSFCSLWFFFRHYMVGMFFSLFLPGAFGGDAARAFFLAKDCKKPRSEAVLTLLAERGVGLLALLVITGAVMFFPQTQTYPDILRWAVIAMATGILLGWAFLYVLPIKAILSKIPFLSRLANAAIYWEDLPLLFKSLGISLVIHTCMIVIHVLISHALGLSLSLPVLIALYGITTLAGAVPLFFMGLGIREGAYTWMLMQVGVAEETALAFGLYWLGVSILMSLLGGLLFLLPAKKSVDTLRSASEMKQ